LENDGSADAMMISSSLGIIPGPMALFAAIMPIKIYIGIVPCDVNIMSYHHDQKWKCGRQHHTTVM